MEKIFILMTGNIYTLAIIAVPIYFLFFVVRKVIKKLPDPAIPTAIIMLPLFLFGASYDRILFDKKVKDVQQALPFFKTYEVAYWGGIIEPMTWFNKYIGFIRLTTPRDPMMAGNYHFNLYYRQDQEPMPKSTFGETYIDAHLVDCDKKEVEVSTVDKKTNLMRKDPSQNFKLNDKDYKFYCLDDWSKYENDFKKFYLSGKSLN